MSRKSLKYSALLFATLLVTALTGCGTGNKEGGTAANVAKVDEATCAQCHGSAYNSQSGMPIYSEYVQSKHFTQGVGCQGCHGGGAEHNGVGPMPYPNPDTAGMCWGCHQPAFLGQYNANKLPTPIEAAHFYNITGAGVHPAMFVTKNFQNGCTACHEPHNPLLGKGAAERKAWASSGHGDINSPAFADEDFKQNTSCIRCHTSTGYSNFLAGTTGGTTGAWSDPFPTSTWATAGDNGREVLTCRTCHVNDSFAVKSAPAFTAPYNSNKNPKAFPDVSKSNLCVACHSGRENADSIEAITDFTSASFKNSHYKAGASLMYMASGFWNYTSSAQKIGTSTRLKTMTPDNVSVPTYGIAGGVTSTHRKLGTTLINGDGHNPSFFVPGVADDGGPCVTCHLNVNGTTPRAAHGHSWQIDVNAAAQICIKCHAGEVSVGGVADATALQTFLDDQSAGFNDALALIANLLQTKYGIKYDPDNYPYFYDLTKDPTGKTAVKDWTRSTMNQVFGKRLMGSAFNLNLLTKDAGSYVHARTYVRRLIYDTIDYLDDNTLNYSVSTTAIAYNSTLYGMGATAYTDGTLTTLATGTTVDMVYLIGWSRSTGAWSVPERP